ncbi:hypothetical protein Tco_0853623 [Tanacetum coccineum]
MMKFSTPRGITTLVTRMVIISECRRLEKKQMLDKKDEHQSVVIEGGLSRACKDQLNAPLKKNLDIFAWQPSDMTGVPSEGGGQMAEG